MKLLLPIFLFTILGLSPLSAEISREKEKEIRNLLEVTGAVKAVSGMKTQMIAQFRTTFRDVPESFWDEFAKELDADKLINLMLPVWDKHFSLEDLRSANTFYATPAGKRLAEKTPVVTSEAFEIGRIWGEEKGKLVVERLKKKGLLK